LKSNITYTEKQTYSSQQIECIELENQIALQLESTALPAPAEAKLNAPAYNNNDPFKANQV